YRSGAKLSVSADVESASSDHVYFRTSLNDYTKMRFRARYQALPSLNFAGDVTLLDNQNPATSVRYDYRARQNSLAVEWAPNGGKRYVVQADYSRATVRSNITYLVPQDLRAAPSVYRENAHLAGATIDLALPGYQGLTPKISA